MLSRKTSKSGVLSVGVAFLIAFALSRRANAFVNNGKCNILSAATATTNKNRIHRPSGTVVSSPASYSRTKESKGIYAGGVLPEPGPCPECGDENGYWDGSTNFVCIACGHEWLVDEGNGGGDNNDEVDDNIRDSNGNVLESGDTVVLTKELGKGLKKGMKVTRIRVGDYGDDHDVQANIPGMGTFNLKSQFLKKTK
mmetsp:Transcript_9225/g.19365  ORF Transcript_9225/g.19365 Transcript_9225/m.19365 type:complete len:197 (+) Transcript_9225:226-816(+)